MRGLLSLYSTKYAQVLVYMLQSTEYKVPAYLAWLHRTKDFSKVMYRRKLVRTRVARLLVLCLRIGMTAQIAVGILIAWWGYAQSNLIFAVLGVSVIIVYPTVWAYFVTVPLQLGRWIIINPRYRRQIKESEHIFREHPGLKIAIAGSYGKTSMKELLAHVLGSAKKVAATPANKNVAISHARFASTLSGKEEVLIIEYGENAPGDIAHFARVTHPDIGIITGLAPAHLDNYPTLASAGRDIFSLHSFVNPENIYVNSESPATAEFLKPAYNTYNAQSVMGWKISKIQVSFKGTSFVMSKANERMKIQSGLLGRHQVGPLALVAALSRHLGVSKTAVEKALATTKAFEHRMQPRFVRGAWILDDTYNGNIDGMKAGLTLLSELPAKRKIYVTPGLVDQGAETKKVHHELGRAIAKARPDRVVLMMNSATRHISEGLKAHAYSGEVQVEHYPLDFYINLEHFIAAGDVVLMQNDWTDNYN